MRAGLARAALCASVSLLACSLAGAASAQVRRFDIPAQPASSAIPEFGRQARVQILVSAAAVENRTTQAVHGAYDARQALELLIMGSGLQVVSDNGKVITLDRAPRPVVAAAASPPPSKPPPTIGRPPALKPQAEPLLRYPQPNELLGEVVVTATRQSDTVNRVPISISVITQRSIDIQGIKNVEDLSRTIPGITFRRSGQEGNANISIRGIGGNGATVGSQTTGIYLDDTALQRRNVNGLVTGNGSPFPLLYDLERVEVLRGPQGTLYGGSSQGGTVRFITPAPNLIDYTASGRVELSGTENGGTNYEIGAAAGGPIVEDKLGLRFSAVYRRTSGYIDALSKYDGHRYASNVNWSTAKGFRLAGAWQVTPQAKVTAALYFSRDYSNADDTFWNPTPANAWTGGPVRNGGTSNAAGPVCTMSQTQALAPCRTTGGVYFAFPDTAIAPFSNIATPWYGQSFKTGNGRYLTTTDVRFDPSPRKSDLFLPSITVDYDLGGMSFKSITSYVNDRTSGVRFAGGAYSNRVTPRVLLGRQPCSTYNNPLGNQAACYMNADYLPGIPDTYSYYYYYNRRNQITQEFRFSSRPSSSPLSWVAGVYFSSSRIHVHGAEHSNENNTSLAVRGVPEAWFIGNYGLPPERNPANAVGPINAWSYDVSDREINLDEAEIAGFGQANYALTDKLKLTAGMRFTRYEQRFFQRYGGAVAGIPLAGVSDANPAGYNPNIPGNAAANPVTDPNDLRPFALNLAGCPMASDCPLQYTTLRVTETPTSPKFGLSYQFNDNTLVYVDVSRGFRAGGVNPAVPPGQCLQDLAALGIPAVPSTFAGDTVTSYEAGSKTRLLGDRLQLNASAFWIDWKGVQFNFPLRCGFAFVTNAAKVVSKGAELQAAGRFGPLTLSANIGYNDAAFAGDVKNPYSGALLQGQGDDLGVPDWTVALGVQYDATLAGKYDAYLRADFQATGRYDRNPGAPVSTYDPLTHDGDPTALWNLRAGATLRRLELALFVQNLTNSRDYLLKGHGQDSLRVTGTTFRPRTVGLQATYRY